MSQVRSQTEGAVTTITLARPERRNAMSSEFMRELIDTLASLDAETQAVVIEAEGPAFSAGHDLTEMIDREPSFYDELFDTCVDLMQMVHRIPQPVIAVVDGVATAAGCQLVAACDLAVATDRSVFATPGVKIGLFCSTPMVPITRAIGRKRAMEMLLTGEPIDASTALDWGLVNRVVAVADLSGEVEQLISRIVRFSPAIIGLGKETFYRQIDVDEPSAYAVTKPVMARNAAMPDAQEGMSAFLEKRTPEWVRD